LYQNDSFALFEPGSLFDRLYILQLDNSGLGFGCYYQLIDGEIVNDCISVVASKLSVGKRQKVASTQEPLLNGKPSEEVKLLGRQLYNKWRSTQGSH